MWKHKLIDFVCQFMEEIDSEISAMKIQVNERARTVGYQYLKVRAALACVVWPFAETSHRARGRSSPRKRCAFVLDGMDALASGQLAGCDSCHARRMRAIVGPPGPARTLHCGCWAHRAGGMAALGRRSRLTAER